jgi:holo-[acyl-carrier protein] synthase
VSTQREPSRLASAARPGARAEHQPAAPQGPRTPAIGIDLLEIERLERALERRPGLAERLFTDGERAYAAARGRPGQHLAARFCAKEAVAKALGLTAWSFRDVEVISGEGAPMVALHGAAAERAAALGVHVEVSLTHTRRDAGAVAILSEDDG